MEPRAPDAPLADDGAREERLNRVLADYLEQERALQVSSRPEFLTRHPDLADDLKAFFDNEDYLRRIDVQLQADARQAQVAPADPQLLSEGFIFADYEILEELACGGMGVVYKARQRTLNRIVALKTIPSRLKASREELQRFLLEAEAVASLDHPNIVPIHAVGEHEGRPYFSMRFIEGGSLSRHTQALVGDPAAAARLIERVARAVEHAHSHGVLHRDLKPSNILVDLDGTPYISDFGLARRLTEDSQLTHSGAILGTPTYMAPEQASGKRTVVTTAADVYSLGAVLYECLCGRPPFRADTPVATLNLVLHEDLVSPRSVNHKIPRDLETICLKCLEKAPANRYASARDLADDLDRYLEGLAIKARPSRPWERLAKWARRRPASAALSLVSLVAILGFVGLGLREMEQRHLHTLELQAQEVLQRKYLYSLSMSKAFEAWDQACCDHARSILDRLRPAPSEGDLRSFEWYWLWRLCHEDRLTLRGHSDVVGRVAFSPSGKEVASAGQDHTARIWERASGRLVATLKDDSSPVEALAFSPDGTILATSNSDCKARLWELASGKVVRVLYGHDGPVGDLAFSPDGQILATASVDRTAGLWQVSDGTFIRRLVGHTEAVSRVAFTPDGRVLATAGRDGTVLFFHPSTGREARGHIHAHGSPIHCMRFSPDGAFLATGGWDRSVILWDTASVTELARFEGHGGAVNDLAFSMDSTRLATASADHKVRVFGTRPFRELHVLKGHGEDANGVAFSPEGAEVATASSDRTVKIWNSEPVREPMVLPLREPEDTLVAATLGEDGRVLVTLACNCAFHVWDLQGARAHGAIRQIRELRADPAQYTARALSPDGTLVALAGRDSSLGIGKLTLSGQEALLGVQASFGGYATPLRDLVFSGNSRSLFAVLGQGSVKAWDNIRVGGRNAWVERAPLEVCPGEEIFEMMVSQDGSILAVAPRERPVVLLWDTIRRAPISILEGHRRAVMAMDFSHDSRRLASGGLDHTIIVWEIDKFPEPGTYMPPSLTLVGHTGAVGCVAFSADDRVLFSGSEDGVVKVWDLVTQSERASLKEHLGEVECLAVSRDGRVLFSAGGRRGQFAEARVYSGATSAEVLTGGEDLAGSR